MDTRRRARLLLLAVLVVVNGYAAQILWTFHLTEPVTMRIVVCEHHQRRSTCFGAPDAGGQTVSVSGATNSDRGD